MWKLISSVSEIVSVKFVKYSCQIVITFNCNSNFFFFNLQMKIPVTGTKTGGYLYIFSIRDPDTNRLVHSVLYQSTGNDDFFI